MSLFDKLKHLDKKKNSTIGFYFGHTEAEGENKAGMQNFQNFFEDYLHVINQIQDERFIFVGRKGSGKSAIAKFVKDTSDTSDNSYASIVRLNELQHERLVQAIPKEEVVDSEAVLFEWIILIRLIALFVKNRDAIYSKQYPKLTAFLTRNSGVVEIDKFQINEVIERKKLEVQIEVLKHVFPVFGKYFDAKTTKAPFYKLIPALKEVVQEVLSYEVYQGKEYYILFDDLDINFKSDNESSCNNLLTLLRTAKLFNTSILSKSKARVLIFLRDDARRIIETYATDTSKIFSSYATELNWYSHDMFKFDENKIGLKRFINKRIALNFDANGIKYNEEDPWESLFEEYQDAFNGKTSFKYVLDYTFYRPRDLILFLNPIGKDDFRFPIKPDSVNLLLKKFVAENIKEFKSELKIYFTEVEVTSLFNKLINITNKPGPISKDDAVKILDNVCSKLSGAKILRILLDYSILILKDNQGKIHFNYREDNQMINIDTMKLSTHKCVYSYFNPETIN